MPVEPWGAITVFSFWGWVLCVVWLALSSFPAPGEFSRARAVVSSSAAVCFFALWVFAMCIA